MSRPVSADLGAFEAPTASSEADPVTVRYYDAPPLETADPLATLQDDGRITVELAEDVAGLLSSVDAVDCVVCGSDDPTAEACLDLLDRVRERDPGLPFVLYAADSEGAAIEHVLDAGWSVVVPADAPEPARRLVHALVTLVAHRRVATLARRATTAIEAAHDGIAVADPEGSVVFANPLFARQFGQEPDEVLGRPWRALFTDDAVAHLEAEALGAVDDDWQWIGACEGRRADGGTVDLQTKLAGTAEGGLVFAVFQRSATEQ